MWTPFNSTASPVKAYEQGQEMAFELCLYLSIDC